MVRHAAPLLWICSPPPGGRVAERGNRPAMRSQCYLVTRAAKSSQIIRARSGVVITKDAPLGGLESRKSTASRQLREVFPRQPGVAGHSGLYLGAQHSDHPCGQPECGLLRAPANGERRTGWGLTMQRVGRRSQLKQRRSATANTRLGGCQCPREAMQGRARGEGQRQQGQASPRSSSAQAACRP